MVLAHPADILASLALSDAITARARLRSAGSLDGHGKDVVMSAAGEGRHFLAVARMSPPGTKRPTSALQRFRRLSRSKPTFSGRRREDRS